MQHPTAPMHQAPTRAADEIREIGARTDLPDGPAALRAASTALLWGAFAAAAIALATWLFG